MIGCGFLAEDALQSLGMSEGSSVLKAVMGKGSRSIRTSAPDTDSEQSTYVESDLWQYLSRKSALFPLKSFLFS